MARWMLWENGAEVSERSREPSSSDYSRHGRNHSEDGVTDVPPVQHPEQLKEGHHADDGTQVSNAGHDGTKVGTAVAK